ncbi:MAG: 2-oxoglutarate dehydrogenase E1 component [Candidatus Latescibacterota bacterium]|nr:MAG: 2-oxoglutarate dehydrogenase E1 component [Candidatus Latescibacterota bacterium]
MNSPDHTGKNRPGSAGFSKPDPLADAYRRWGYLQADLEWLNRLEKIVHPDITEAAERNDPEADAKWKAIYCGSIGVEFMHIADPERRRWVATRMESDDSAPQTTGIIDRIARSELFERFLHARYVGSKRYSIEGVAGVIPLLDSIFDTFAQNGGELVMIAMSHRGRLNVLTNIVNVPAADIFAGMEDVDPRSVLGSGDVKYHLGATGRHTTPAGNSLEVRLSSNPSHLELVDPVLMGRVRAKQDRAGEGATNRILGITLHGDAAFAGQGVVPETLNLSQLPGYRVGGTIRVIVNNLIGFTAQHPKLHSSKFSSDVAKRLSIPIYHVNGEDPIAVCRAGRMAMEYRTQFGDDVVVDIIGYRRYGHSEVEDPSITQPTLYRTIENRPMLWEMFAERMGEKPEAIEARRDEIWQDLEHEHEVGRSKLHRPVLHRLPSYWDPYRGGPYIPALEVDASVPAERLRDIANALTTAPESFNIHPKIQRLFDQRIKMVMGEKPVDWGMAEALAMGSLLWEGIPIRLSGQDCGRGTFNQRHAVIIDTENGNDYRPLAHLRPGQGRFTVIDSPLSESAPLGFEYGYSRDYPDALVCWEAQFGDFANVAQPMIDQFLSAGEDKWRLLSGLVLLLPHGFEGQGPEHSSARLERFLQLAAEDNIQICQPSMSCQYYHLLRRQALRIWRKPLVIFTPKGLLRAAGASSPIDAFASGGCFKLVLPDDNVDNAERILICSGKISHELKAERDRREDGNTAVICLAQLYPFPKDELKGVLDRHPNARKIVWVQEEPGNNGALAFVRPHLQRLLGDRHLVTVKRSDSASPATGSINAHKLEQQALIRLAFA